MVAIIIIETDVEFRSNDSLTSELRYLVELKHYTQLLFLLTTIMVINIQHCDHASVQFGSVDSACLDVGHT